MSLRQRLEQAESEMTERVVDGYESHEDGVCLIVKGRVLMKAKTLQKAAEDNGLTPEALRIWVGAREEQE